MCFSASASLISGTALSAVGVVTIKKAKSKAELPLAIIPLLFGMQQITEGFVWLSLGWNTPALTTIATYVYLFFAYILWPIWGPFAMRQLETVHWRKKIMYVLQILGVIVGIYFLYFLSSSTATCKIIGNHIVYSTPPFYGLLIATFFYLVVTCGSCLVSSHALIRYGGILGLFAFAAAYYFYAVAFVSVWCFFAALLSGLIYLYFNNS